ncbi:FecR family protein [Pedobacter nyackensis]|uniref:FecR family protein n=1 Tax=Pedobacter nyackensis TaxID=475255 RepID=A0A1W2A332_9SPHI|nr:FecR family protein [Pedobacter nyackensis]SMC54851.1 FecR family protein [Pedobacter nyackensis]
MNTDPSRVKSLFRKHLEGTASPEEVRELFSLIGQDKIDEEILSSLDSELSETDSLNPYDKERWDLIFDKIKDDSAVIEEDVIPVKKRTYSFLRTGIAAAIVLVVGAGVLLYNQSNKVVQTMVYVNDVAPGSSGATLTLASGERIALSDAVNGELAKEAGLSISKTADGQLVYEVKDQAKAGENKINTLSTAKGETYRVRLPDGSLVWLNAASSLTYATSLNEHGERRVTLSGEAYFEIFKDKKHPFIVESKGQEVEVLGTHFNVNAYGDEASIKTTLLEGSVQITLLPLSTSGGKRDVRQRGGGGAEKGNWNTILKPNQQAVVNGDKLDVFTANIEQTIAWKNGSFAFHKQSLKDIMRNLARWYDVEVVYDPGFKDALFTGSVSRFKSMSTILHILEITGKVHFKVEGRKVIVME